jgi:DNA repair protein RadC
MTIQLSEEQKIKIINSVSVYNVMQEILLREEEIDQEKEHFWLIGLAQNNQMQYIELVSLGSVNATTVEPMNVFRWAVMKGSVKVIMVHNHPSGEVRPSDADKDLTDRLIQVGRILNIEVIDHLIITTRIFLSFSDIGLMDKLAQSTKWVPQFELIERMRREEKKLRDEAVMIEKEKGKIAKEKAIKKEKIAIAKAGLKKGLTVDIISDLTGLTQSEIEKLK